MTTEPPTTPWPPVLGTPATGSLVLGFDGAATRLVEVIGTAAHQ